MIFRLSASDVDESESENYQHEPEVTISEPDRVSEQVIEAVLGTLPPNDSSGYTKTLKKIKWNEIKVENRKPEEIEKIFYHAIKDVNKVRTLTEILNDAKKRMSTFNLHPDHPKRPKTLFAMYVQDRYKQVKDENPGLEAVITRKS